MSSNGRPILVLGIIQARCSSARLPGKVVKPVLGKPLLSYLLERIRPSVAVDKWVVATSHYAEDNVVVDVCRSNGVDCFRGQLDDVLDRYYQCASSYQPQVVVRLTADCPLHHFQVVDDVVQRFNAARADYCTNSFPPTLEDGFDTEVFRFACLEQAWRRAQSDPEREHVTSRMRTDTTLRRVFQKCWPAYEYKLSVDTPEDFSVVSRILAALYPTKPLFTMHDVIEWIDAHPAFVVSRVKIPVEVHGSS